MQNPTIHLYIEAVFCTVHFLYISYNLQTFIDTERFILLFFQPVLSNLYFTEIP